MIITHHHNYGRKCAVSTLLEHFNNQSPARRKVIAAMCILMLFVGIWCIGKLVAPEPIVCGDHQVSAEVREGYGFQATLEDALAQGGYDQVENLVTAAQQAQDGQSYPRRGDTVTACLEKGDKRIATVGHGRAHTQIVG